VPIARIGNDEKSTFAEYGTQLRIEDDDRLVLNVLYGTIGLYGVDFTLKTTETKGHRRSGDAFTKELAIKVLPDPKKFRSRNAPQNPYESPTTPIESESGTLPPSAVTKATNLIRDARLTVAVALIPIIGLVFILRLVQWYLLRRQYPVLAETDAGEHAQLAKDFRTALPRLWFAVLLWPGVVVLSVAYFLITG
jgi:hypothetical protein